MDTDAINCGYQYSSTPEVKIEENCVRLGNNNNFFYFSLSVPRHCTCVRMCKQDPPACSIILLHNLYRS